MAWPSHILPRTVVVSSINYRRREKKESYKNITSGFFLIDYPVFWWCKYLIFIFKVFPDYSVQKYTCCTIYLFLYNCVCFFSILLELQNHQVAEFMKIFWVMSQAKEAGMQRRVEAQAMSKKVTSFSTRSKFVTPKYVTLASGLSWVKGNWNPANSGRSSLP